MERLKVKEVATWRVRQLEKQGGNCALCGMPCDPSEAVADHKHSGEGAGRMRGVLHRGCNVFLGKVENCVQINKLQDRLDALVAQRVIQYMSEVLDVYHPSWRTTEEKRIRRNKKAKARRANRKAS